MKLYSAAILVVLAAPTPGCDLNNIDRAEPHTIPMETLEACETFAAQLDAQVRQRVFCIPVREALHGETE